MSTTLRVLARLLEYPGAELREHLPELREALHAERALSASHLTALDTLIDWLGGPRPLDVEAIYVDTFDRGRRTALHLFEHVHGDSRDRGPAMIDLTRSYEQAGLYLAHGEMPDHLAVVLEYASTQPPAQARAFLGEMAHILQALAAALQARHSPYAGALTALLTLAGEKSSMPAEAGVPVDDTHALDTAWEEPPAFGGCAQTGQSAPAAPQPIHIVRRRAAAQPSGAQP